MHRIPQQKRGKFDWEHDHTSDLEVVDERPKRIDPGVRDEFGEDLDGKERTKERPSYATRAAAPRRRAGLTRGFRRYREAH